MKVVALAGGVGGARLVEGLARMDVDLTVVVNTGDDFDHWGLRVCPDLDTITYTLADLSDRERGWGLRGETWAALEGMRRLGAEEWFALGDRDLATHLRRTEWLRGGLSLSEVTRRLADAHGVRTRILPMSDAPCPTVVNGEAFQTWLVRQRAPTVRSLRLTPGPAAPGVQQALHDADRIVLAPSNPYVSIDPILGCVELPAATPLLGVSPIVEGRAVKGPLAEMIPALAGRPASTDAVLDHYATRGLRFERFLSGPSTVMSGPDDSERVARELLA